MQLGVDGETIAADYLAGLGYQILERDLRTPLGQIDVVARDGATLVIVEVKTRAGVGFGLPQEGVGAQKIRKLRQLGAYYMQRSGHRGTVRFDVVGIVARGGRVLRLDHIKNAIQ